MRTRLGIDCRRVRYDGVGRFTTLMVRAVAAQIPEVQPVLFGDPGDLRCFAEVAELVDYDAKLLSARDFERFPALAAKHGIDVFLAPQYYCSPMVRCAQIRVLHDAFPLRPDFYSPAPEVFEQRFGREALTELAALLGISSSAVTPRTLIGRLYQESVRNADVLVTVSRYSREDLATYFPDAVDRIRVVPLYVTGELRCGCTDIAVPEPGLRLLHVSKWEPRKRQLSLLDTVQELRRCGWDVRVELIGRPADSFPEYGAQVLNRVTTGAQQGWITWRPYATDTELHHAYHSCTAFVTLSAQEGFALPALEALQAGAVCVAPRLGALPEVGGSAIYYLDPDLADIDVDLAYLFDNMDLRTTLSARGRRRARRYSQHRTAVALRGVLERL